MFDGDSLWWFLVVVSRWGLRCLADKPANEVWTRRRCLSSILMKSHRLLLRWRRRLLFMRRRRCWLSFRNAPGVVKEKAPDVVTDKANEKAPDVVTYILVFVSSFSSLIIYRWFAKEILVYFEYILLTLNISCFLLIFSFNYLNRSKSSLSCSFICKCFFMTYAYLWRIDLCICL